MPNKKQRNKDETLFRIAIAGNPNCGKTSIFNALTGSHQHVGNYAGVTVERRGGHFSLDDLEFDVIDLPGSYSLTSYSPEELIAQDELLLNTPDVIVVVADSTNLARSMVILSQIMHLRARLVLCLNMADEARESGQELDLELLSQLLGFAVIETVGHRGEGIDALRQSIVEAVEAPIPRRRLVLGERLDGGISEVTGLLVETEIAEHTHEWIATKLISHDEVFTERISREASGGQAALVAAREARRRIERETGLDIELFITERYYGFVDGLLREVTKRRSREDARALSDRIDSVLAHRVLGLPFFLFVMYAIFWVTFTIGQYPMDWLEQGFDSLAEWVNGLWAVGSSSLLRSLIVDGIIKGVGGVLVFLPNIVLLFLGLALLEDTGYMARAAFLVDAVMHRFGLHGRSFIPMLSGFGCTVPGIMATRTLENERDRLITMLVLPLMSCGARLPIYMLLIPAFFPPVWRAPVLWGIYMFGILLALGLALLLRRSIFRGQEAPFVMELPPYRLPTSRAIVFKMFERSWLYLKKAGTLILAISILMWAAATFPRLETSTTDGSGETVSDSRQENHRQSESLRHSLAGRIGVAMEPALRPMGLDWRAGTAMIGAFAAKEVFVAQMGIVYALGETDEESTPLQAAIRRDYSTPAGAALLLFLLIATPCMATLAVTKRESGSWKWALVQWVGLTTLGYLIAVAVFQLGRLFL